jgi:hypothetical protein
MKDLIKRRFSDGVLVVNFREFAKQVELPYERLEALCVDVWKTVPEDLSIYDLMVLWREITYAGLNSLETLSCIDSFQYFMSDQEFATFCRLKFSVVVDASLVLAGRSGEHGRVHSWFTRNVGSVIPGASLIKVKAIQNKRPDFLVSIDRVVFPVECKLSFNKSALKQLQGYMSLWEVDRGFAVAPNLKCKLPPQIEFIQCP